ncbi:MAG: S41 family peptidase [Spirochaetota bacterium]
MKEEQTMNRRTERFIWAGVSTVLVGLVVAMLFAPTVLAQSQRSDRAALFSSFESVFSYIERNFVEEVSDEVLIQGALQGMFESLDDRYSAYLPPREMENLNDVTTGAFGGVGMYISRTDDDEEGFVEVVEPIPGTPAFRAGVRIGDEIYEIDGVSAQGFTTEEVANLLRGPEGSEVEVVVRRAGNRFETYELTRARVEVPTVRAEMMDDGTGYMRVQSFTPFTVPRMREYLEEFIDDDMDGLVLDLRGNSGGLLRAAVDAADLFISDGLIVGTTSRIPRESTEFRARSGTTMLGRDVPMVVLIDGASASGAEILAGALQDSERAQLVGLRTFGKGSVQQVQTTGAIPGGFRLTLSRYYTPDGTYIDEIGIEPDVEVEPATLTEEEEENYADLLGSRRVEEFVSADREPSERRIDSFVAELARDFEVPEPFVMRFVTEELARAENRAIVYDLDFDVMLREALRVLQRDPVSLR